MKKARCPDCKKIKLLTKHSEIGGHAEGTGYIYICRDCHDKEHGIKNKRKNMRHQKGSGGKTAKGTVRRKRK